MKKSSFSMILSVVFFCSSCLVSFRWNSRRSTQIRKITEHGVVTEVPAVRRWKSVKIREKMKEVLKTPAIAGRQQRYALHVLTDFLVLVEQEKKVLSRNEKRLAEFLYKILKRGVVSEATKKLKVILAIEDLERFMEEKVPRPARIRQALRFIKFRSAPYWYRPDLIAKAINFLQILESLQEKEIEETSE